MRGNRLPLLTSAKSTRPASKSSRLTVISSSVIVHDFNVPDRTVVPLKAYPPLIVDADTVLPSPIAPQRLQPIARWYEQIVELLGCIDSEKLGSCATLNLSWQSLD